jgi:cobalt-zinc-cadmium efflux system membrane fusion protein
MLYITATFAAPQHNHEENHKNHQHSRKEELNEITAAHPSSFKKEEAEEEHENHEGHDHHDHETNGISISQDMRKNLNIVVESASLKQFSRELIFPGEIQLNMDNTVHVVPKTNGITLEVIATLGDTVKKHQPLAIIDSMDLGEAKADFFQQQMQMELAMMELNRAVLIRKNTSSLLNSLQSNPSLSELPNISKGDMGDFQTEILSSYSELVIQKAEFSKKQKLHKDGITSDTSYLETQGAMQQANAAYFSTVDNVKFAIQRNVSEFQKKARVCQLKLRSAKHRLLQMGLSHSDIEAMLQQENSSDMSVTDCPDCKFSDTGAVLSNPFTRISLLSPIDGTIIQRHLAIGEMIPADREIFTIADMNTVWAVFQINSHAIHLYENGSPVTVKTAAGNYSAKIDRINPVLNEESRTVTARVILENHNRALHPGMFVNIVCKASDKDAVLAVSTDAVQNIAGESVLFSPIDEDEFKTVPVKIGRQNSHLTEILSGIHEGEPYVSKGAFELKAVLTTSNIDPHAGHGH